MHDGVRLRVSTRYTCIRRVNGLVVHTSVAWSGFGSYNRRAVSQKRWVSADEYNLRPTVGQTTSDMFEWWKDLIRPIRIKDSRFGNLRYLRDARFWEGQAAFVPTHTVVEVLISGEPSGPTEQQRVFFNELEQRYNSLWPEVRKRLETEAQRAQIDGAREFILVCVDFPPAGSIGSDPEWALSYETDPRSWHFTVRMTGWTPSDVVAEC